MTATAIAHILHVLFSVVWVGGMFFAYVVVRPALPALLEPPGRLAFWRRVLGRFFVWVGVAVAVILLSGYWVGFSRFGAMAHFPTYVHVMHGLGWVMAALFVVLLLAGYRPMCRALDAGDTAAAARGLAVIRRLVALNLAIGLVVIAVAVGGGYGLLAG